jgi:hypothetical protein
MSGADLRSDADSAPARIVRPRPRGLIRWLRHAGIVTCFVALYLAVFEILLVLGVLALTAWKELDRPALCADLPDAPDAVAYAFADRIYMAFPVGTPWRAVRDRLQAEGFRPILPHAGRLNPGGHYVIETFDSDIWCEVRWTSDATGAVTSVRPLWLDLAYGPREKRSAGDR